MFQEHWGEGQGGGMGVLENRQNFWQNQSMNIDVNLYPDILQANSFFSSFFSSFKKIFLNNNNVTKTAP